MRETRTEIVAVVTSRLAGCISLGEVSPVGEREIDLTAMLLVERGWGRRQWEVL
jgi:hypothetical protein